MAEYIKPEPRTYLIVLEEEQEPRYDELVQHGRGYSIKPVRRIRVNTNAVVYSKYQISISALMHARDPQILKDHGRRKIVEGLVSAMDSHPQCRDQFALVNEHQLKIVEDYYDQEIRLACWAAKWGLE